MGFCYAGCTRRVQYKELHYCRGGSSDDYPVLQVESRVKVRELTCRETTAIDDDMSCEIAVL